MQFGWQRCWSIVSRFRPTNKSCRLCLHIIHTSTRKQCARSWLLSFVWTFQIHLCLVSFFYLSSHETTKPSLFYVVPKQRRIGKKSSRILNDSRERSSVKSISVFFGVRPDLGLRLNNLHIAQHRLEINFHFGHFSNQKPTSNGPEFLGVIFVIEFDFEFFFQI